MATNHETGHAKNVANLQRLVEQVTVYTGYNPSVDALSLENLNTLYDKSLASLVALEEARNQNKNAIHARQQYFKPLNTICTRVVNYVELLGLNEGDLNQVKYLNKLIQGSNRNLNSLTPIEESEIEEAEAQDTPQTYSTSRQSYTQRTDNFSKMIQLLESFPGYAPNVSQITLESLNQLKDKLIDATKAVDQTKAQLNVALINRDATLYGVGNGLYATTLNVKRYIKSLYGAKSPNYTRVARIKFTNK